MATIVSICVHLGLAIESRECRKKVESGELGVECGDNIRSSDQGMMNGKW